MLTCLGNLARSFTTEMSTDGVKLVAQSAGVRSRPMPNNSQQLTLPLTFACLYAREKTMTYDWDGQRTRRIVAVKLMTAVAIGLSVPLAVTLWTFIG